MQCSARCSMWLEEIRRSLPNSKSDLTLGAENLVNIEDRRLLRFTTFDCK